MSAVREIRKSVVVAHRAEEMFGLVNDVESYPQFLPWCASARVLQQDDSVMLASLDMAMAGLHKRLTTRNLLQPHRRVELRLVEGPFSRFHAVWTFDELGKPRHGRRRGSAFTSPTRWPAGCWAWRWARCWGW